MDGCYRPPTPCQWPTTVDNRMQVPTHLLQRDFVPLQNLHQQECFIQLLDALQHQQHAGRPENFWLYSCNIWAFMPRARARAA